VPDERCDNCRDDDGNGLIDAEDPRCCASRADGTLQRGLLRPRADGTTTLRLNATLGDAGLAVDPPAEDVSLLVRAGDGEPLCVVLPAGSFTQRGRRFRHQGPKETAGVLRRAVIPVKADGTVRYRALGPRLPFPIDATASRLAVAVTVGFHPSGGETARCSTMRADFRRRGRGYKAKGG